MSDPTESHAMPPYGAPPASAPPSFVAPGGAPRYAQPPADAVRVPHSSAAMYARPSSGEQSTPPSAVRPAASRFSLGVIAFVLSLVAAAGASLVGAIAGWQVGLGTNLQAVMSGSAPFTWRLLSPVRGWVLLGEIAFWTGTVVGVMALVLGIIAIVKNRSRVLAIVALVITVLGPTVFFVALQAALVAGVPAGLGG